MVHLGKPFCTLLLFSLSCHFCTWALPGWQDNKRRWVWQFSGLLTRICKTATNSVNQKGGLSLRCCNYRVLGAVSGSSPFPASTVPRRHYTSTVFWASPAVQRYVMCIFRLPAEYDYVCALQWTDILSRVYLCVWLCALNCLTPWPWTRLVVWTWMDR